jgi:hypothetical protein
MVMASGTWSTTRVNALLAGLIGIAATLLGSFTTYLWFYRRRDPAGAEYLAARIECDGLGASAEAARFRVQLVSGDPEVMMLADAAFTAVGALSSSADRDELRERENRLEAAVTMFIHAASGRLRMNTPAPAPGRPGPVPPASTAQPERGPES